MQKGCSADALVQFINSLNGAPYNRLRELLGFEYEFPVMEFIGKAALTVRTIQPDPFAPGSQVKLSVLLPKISKIIPYGFQANSPECIATADFLLRCVRKNLNLRIELLNPSMHVLQRSAVTITDGNIATFHFRASLPGHGRRIDSRGCVNMLYHEPLMMIQNLNSMNFDELSNHVECVKQQLELQGLLSTHGLVAFVRDGAILPRQGGASDFPLDRERSVPFSSPPNLRTSLTLSNGTTFTGMGIPKGVTVITGGGFHGKSTLLRALEVGIYPHVPGDGREFVVCDPNAVKIRAEDRRSVTGVNISSYIRQTPFAGSTVSFSTRDASGSTSQAANIVEALELGCSTLLIDEDTSATNFMVRDELIAALVKSEPIVPFVSRVRELYERFMVSSILVVGGSGQFLHVADTVVNMHEYSPVDATAEARELLSSRPGLCALPPSPSTCLNVIQHKHRKVNWNNSFQCLQANRAIVRANPNTLQFGEENVDISFLEQLVEPYQATYIAEALCAALHAQDRKVLSITEIARLFDHSVSEPNLSSPFTSRFPAGFSSRARPFEIGAALNRLRSLHLRS